MFKNFIPTVWSAGIEKALDQNCVMTEDCNRKYEGDVENKGDRVKILGVGKPSVYDLARDNADNDINAPETIEDASLYMDIDHISYYNFMVNDIDQAQMQPGGIMDLLQDEVNEELAVKVDAFIAAKAVDPLVDKLFSTVPQVVAGTPSSGQKNVLDILDLAQQKLFERNVNQKTEIVVDISPRFYTLFRKEYRLADTNNSEILKNGFVAKYGNMTIKMSNGVYTSQTTSAGDTDNILIRTKRAIAYACPKVHVEAFRPEKKFSDALKGFILYGGKVVRPKEVLNINVKYA